MSSSSKQPRKRGREHDPGFLEPASKRHRLCSEGSPPARLLTPSLTAASPMRDIPSFRRPHTLSAVEPILCKVRSQPNLARRELHNRDNHQYAEYQATGSSPEFQANWFLDEWLENLARTSSVQKEVEDSNIITVDGNPGPEIGCDQMSRQDAESTRAPGSTVSEKLKVSSPMYRGALKMNGVVIDNLGDDMPRDIQDLVTKHIRKSRTSPPLEEDTKASIRQKIKDVWDSPEPAVSDIITAPLFDLAHPALAVGREMLWSSRPLPRNPDYPLVTPKTDHHVGFQPTLKSEWTQAELAAADNSRARPYSQPTRENLFPSFLLEVKSEAIGGTLYGAESQLATAGLHRVHSLMWVLDQIEPNRTRSSCDAIVFSIALCQREAIAHVHYYNPDKAAFYMSYIDSFYFAKDVQGCHDYVKNVVEWMLQIQQPVIRNALTALHPISQSWKQPSRPATSVADAGESSFGSDGSSAKKQ